MKITGGNLNDISVDKALSHSNTNSFEMQDVSSIVERDQVKPRLLTALFGGSINSEFLTTDTFKYDELTHTMQLPAGKAYHDFGPRLTKDKPRELIYSVGSFGLSANVAPRDYANRRQAGSQELMNEAYVVAQMNKKMADAWSAFQEIAIAQLLTTDTNINRGNTTDIVQYNFYTDIVGSSRPAATDMDLGDNTIDHFQAFADQKDILEENVEKTMSDMTMPICLCGKNFFNKRLYIEKQQGFQGAQTLHRDVAGLDLASMGVPESSFGSGRFNYQYFDSHDGIRYIRYSVTLGGSKLIADNDAYLVPTGVSNFMRMVYSPAQTREYTNTTAQSRYGWSKEDDRNGVTLWTESNVLPINVNPTLIVPLTTTT